MYEFKIYYNKLLLRSFQIRIQRKGSDPFGSGSIPMLISGFVCKRTVLRIQNYLIRILIKIYLQFITDPDPNFQVVSDPDEDPFLDPLRIQHTCRNFFFF